MKLPQRRVLSKHLSKPSTPYHYGNSGYFLNTPDINSVVCRASVIAYIRSSTLAGKYVGVYITAGHNPSDYNGIKIIDFNGNILEESWEQGTDELVNCEDQDFIATVNKLFRQNSNCTNMHDSIIGNVVIGRDTRDSGVELAANIAEVLGKMRCNVRDYGLATCPEIHYLVRKSNEQGELLEKATYIEHIHAEYTLLRLSTGLDAKMDVDTAHGAVTEKLNDLRALQGMPDFNILDSEKETDNNNGGVDNLKTTGSCSTVSKGESRAIAKFDFDGSRLVMLADDGAVLDGDAQATHIANYIKAQVEAEGIPCRMGVVLSFYSNMGAVEYLQKNYSVIFSQPGIKNFSREAREFDVGVFFEPNGHGSVFFSKGFIERVEALENREHPLKRLVCLFDPFVGDALVNFLVIKAITGAFDSFIRYKENFVRLISVKVADRTVIKVNKNNVIVAPDIQNSIDQVIATFKGRGFVRPSGTENAIRIFAENRQEVQCDRLALNIAQIVYDNCGGIGPYPEIVYPE